MNPAWTELDRLRIRVSALRNRIAAREAMLRSMPRISPVRFVSEEKCRAVGVSGDEGKYFDGVSFFREGPACVLSDRDSVKFAIPADSGLAVVQDQGDGTGKAVRISISGVVSALDAVSLPLVVAEPASKFHDSAYPQETGRVYPGKRMKSPGGQEFYLVFVAGFGPAQDAETLDFETESYEISLVLEHDSAGKIISFSGSYEETAFWIDTRFVTYEGSGPTTSVPVGGVYYCYWQVLALTTAPTYLGFRTNVTKYRLLAFDDYDPGTQVFSNELFRTDDTVFVSQAAVNVKTAGTGIANKTSFYPSGVHPYAYNSYAGVQHLSALQVKETGEDISGVATGGNDTTLEDSGKDFRLLGVVAGDVIETENPTRIETIISVSGSTLVFASGDIIISGTTTYFLAKKNRQSIPRLISGSYDNQWYWKRWGLSLTNEPSYDPVTDTYVTYSDPAYPFVALRGNNTAAFGWNEEATKFVAFVRPSTGNRGPIPGLAPKIWPTSLGNYNTEQTALYYCTVNGIFKPDHDVNGGKVYWPRKASDWKYWNGSAWVAASAGSFSLNLWGYDEFEGEGRVALALGTGFYLY